MIGILDLHRKFESMYVPQRNVEVWLPPAYFIQSANSYPVIYMHDGQNLFNSETANINIDWGLDETLSGLMQDGKIPEAIVVGIWNSEHRWREYMPQKVLELPQASRARNEFIALYGGEAYSDSYLKFLVIELKPFIDQNYRTMPGWENTHIMGSSMGGLVSIYALCEYPQVFRTAGCLSTHWPAGQGMTIAYLRDALPKSGQHKIYFDYGTETLDAHYEEFQVKVDVIMQDAGYIQGKDWITRKFPGAEHSERAWRQRVHIPLEFLLK